MIGESLSIADGERQRDKDRETETEKSVGRNSKDKETGKPEILLFRKAQ